ncbi:lipopolysaccharide biosynthesis protein [Vibrio maritimus]|uniref:lipopolysaccharide biosynthesis protein n=1 Tax=Vibrio maritimus TaxID=990268 RepID=UPI001F3109F6|nr:oligosaccharide flippase family protein [Vibrio maritimus]
MNIAFKQSVYYAAGLVLMKGVSFVMLPFITSSLSTAEYGRLDLWVSLLNIGSILLGFGLIEALYKQAGEAKGDAFNTLNSTATMQQLIIAAFALLASLPVGVAVYVFWPEISILDLGLVICTLIVSAAFNIPLTWLRLIDDARSFFLMTSSKAILQAALTYWFLQQGLGVTGILLSGLLSALYLSCSLLYRQWRQLPFQWDAAVAKDMRRYGVPIVASGILLFIAAGAERWILAATIGLESLAIYALAMQFALIIVFVCEPLALWWYPKRFQILNQPNGKQTTARIAETLSHATLFCAVSLSVVAPLIIEWWFPTRYSEAATWIPWLALGIAFKQLSHILTTGCYVEKQPRVVLNINIIIAITALALFLVASLTYGLAGVVGAFITVYALRAVLFDRASQKRIALPHHYLPLIAHICWAVGCIVASTFTYTALLVGWATQSLFIAGWMGHYWLHNSKANESILGAKQ